MLNKIIMSLGLLLITVIASGEAKANVIAIPTHEDTRKYCSEYAEVVQKSEYSVTVPCSLATPGGMNPSVCSIFPDSCWRFITTFLPAGKSIKMNFGDDTGLLMSLLMKLMNADIPSTEHNREVARILGIQSLYLAGTALESNSKEAYEFYKKGGLALVNIALNLAPPTAFALDLYTLYSGKNFITGEEVSSFERSLSAIGVMTLGTSFLLEGELRLIATGNKYIASANGTGMTAEGILNLRKSVGEVLDSGARYGLRSAEEMAGMYQSTRGAVDSSADVARVLANAERVGISESKDIVANANLLNRIEPGFANVVMKDADELNAISRSLKMEPPYHSGTKAFEIETTKTEEWVRAYSGKADGRWLMKKSDAGTLNGKEIAKKYNMPNEPTKLAIVTTPPGTKVRGSIVGANSYGNSSGAIQYEITGDIFPEWFEFFKDL